MKKIGNFVIILIFICFTVLPLVSCVSSRYNLEVLGNDDYVINLPKNGKYKVGEIFKFKIERITDTDLCVFFNNEYIEAINGEDSNFNYYEIKMPNVDSKLVVTSDRFYVNRGYAFSEIFYFLKDINEDDIISISILEGDNIVLNNREEMVGSIVYTDSLIIGNHINYLKTKTLYRTTHINSNLDEYKVICYRFSHNGGSPYNELILILDGLVFKMPNSSGWSYYFRVDESSFPESSFIFE